MIYIKTPKRTSFVLFFLLFSVLLGFSQVPDKAQELYSPEYAASGSFVTSYNSPQADSVNPAASALTQRVTLDLNYFALAGEEGAAAGLQGHAVNLGAAIPTKAGVLSFSGHYLGSDFPGYPADTDVTLKGAFSKELYPGIAAGAGAGFGLSGSGGVSAVFDAGLIQELGPKGFVKDLRWGAALQNLGYTTIEGAYPDPFSFLVGFRAQLLDKDSVDFAVSSELGFPGFNNVRMGLGGELRIGDFLTVHSGSRLDLNRLMEGDTAQLIPSVGVVFSFTTDISEESDFLGLSERGWNRSEIRTSFTAAPVIENVWAFGGGVNIPLGVIDKKPPEITIDIDGIFQGDEDDNDGAAGDDGGDVSFYEHQYGPEADKARVVTSPPKNRTAGPRKVQNGDAKSGSGKDDVKKETGPVLPEEKVIAYLSPNNDGVKDEISIPVTISDSRYITKFQFIVENSEGEPVRTIENKEKRIENEGFRGFFDRLFSVKTGIEIPPYIRWDGTDDKGSTAEDGVYYFFLRAYDDNGNMSSTERYPIVVDNTAPELEIVQPEEERKIFSPNSDGNKDTLTIAQTGSYEELWEARVLDAASKSVRTVAWENGAPEDFTWDGTDNGGILLPDGVYTYRISSEDRAGNRTEGAVGNIVLNTEVTPISLAVDRSHFSPNGDDTLDFLVLTPGIPVERGIVSWEMNIRNESGMIVRSYEGELAVPEKIGFDGKDEAGMVLDEGAYRAELRVLYENGNYPAAVSAPFTLDVTEPEALVRVSDTVFSPDGDGRKDTITFYNETSLETRWYGTVSALNEDGRSAVRSYEWVDNAPAQVTWDGITDNGSLAPDGNYFYRLTAVDRAGNAGRSSEIGFALDTSETEVIFSSEYSAFSPNGDGIKDRIGLSPKLQQPDGIEKYTVSVLDESGTEVRVIEGNGAPPERIFWDGRDDRRSTVPDGLYRARLKLVYAKGTEPEAETRVFTLDTEFPEAALSAEYTLFSPDGDGRKDALLIGQQGSDEQLWSGSVIDSEGETVKRVFWKGKPGDYQWDGTSEAGNRVPDGRYSYVLVSEDEAGNRFETELDSIMVDTAPTRIFVTAGGTALSPNGDGKFEDISFSTIVNNRDGVSGWELELVTLNDGNVRKKFSGNDRIPEGIIWDGRNESGNFVEGAYRARFTVQYEKGNRPVAESSEFILDRSAPEIDVKPAPVPFSPDNDGIDDELTIDIEVEDASDIESWSLTIYDPEGKVFKEYGGTGAPGGRIIWDGKSAEGELVYAAMDYPFRMTAVDVLGNRAYEDGLIPVDVLVVREGDLLKIKIASIIFQPDKAEFAEEDPAVAERNRYVLDRLAEILQKYRNYQITVEGHAALINWADPKKAAIEEETELQPLSRQRAERVVKALVERGIDAGRLSALGVGGTKPLVPHSDLENRWKNRRVEFILEKKR